MTRAFDRKFGSDFVAALPSSPGVYRIYDKSDDLIYVGKAKNLRRRLSQYRNAKRCKKHHKMRTIIKDANRIETEHCATDLDACLLENRLIQAHRPKWNVAGAFYFLYPMIGIQNNESGTLSFCYTTEPDRASDFRIHGAFRSRGITGEAFFSLMKLLRFVGHPVKKPLSSRLSRLYVFSFRRIPDGWPELFEAFLKGESKTFLEQLVLALVENAAARKDPAQIQELLNTQVVFWKHEAQPLAKARHLSHYSSYPVSQKDRDKVFLLAKLQGTQTASDANVSRQTSIHFSTDSLSRSDLGS